jgi:hypothetical protein
MRFLRHKDFPEKGIDYTKTYIWKLRQLPPGDPRKFPDPVKGLAKEDCWTESEIDDYVARRSRRAKFALKSLRRKMTQASAGIVQDEARRGRTKLGRFLPGVSGNPAGSRLKGKRLTELFDALAAEFGELDAVERTLLEQACRLLTKGARVADPDQAVRLANASTRLLLAMRKARDKRPPAGPTLAEYLASRHDAGLPEAAE